MTLSSRERAQRLLKDWGIEPSTVAEDGLNEWGYWRFGEAPKGYIHACKYEEGVRPRHWVPWPEGFPAEEMLSLVYPWRTVNLSMERVAQSFQRMSETLTINANVFSQSFTIPNMSYVMAS